MSKSIYKVCIQSFDFHFLVISQIWWFYIQTNLRRKFGFSTTRRIRQFMTVNHLVILINHMCKKNWHQYRHERILVQNHAAYMFFICSSERVSEYFESNMRRGSGRGLMDEVSVGPQESGKGPCYESDNRLCYFQKWRRRDGLKCESQEMQKTFRRRHTKDDSEHFRTSSTSNLCRLFRLILDRSMKFMRTWSHCLRTQCCSCWQSLWRITSFRIIELLKRSKRFHHLQMNLYIIFASKRTCFAYHSFESYRRMNPLKRFMKRSRSAVGQ